MPDEPPREFPSPIPPTNLRIHARALNAVREYLEDAGMDAASIDQRFKQYALSVPAETDYNAFVSLDGYAHLLRDLARYYKNDALGLTFGTRTQFASIGALGQAFKTAPTVAAALEVMSDNMPLYATVSATSFEIGAQSARFSWSYSPLMMTFDQLCDRAARLLVQAIETCFVPGWRPTEVSLQRRLPDDVSPYREVLAPLVRFGCASNVITFPASDLSRPNVNADPHAHEAAMQLVRRMVAEQRQDPSLVVLVCEDILTYAADGSARLQDTASRLGMSARALQRGLEHEQTSFQALRETALRQLAQELLLETDLPIGEVAFRLGFSNQANLARAATRWFGRSPRQIRGGTETRIMQ
ncbi:MAG: AraC family transcriptional regulator ligand-binding domain-containing protein [Pseudomonadota bacterium]